MDEQKISHYRILKKLAKGGMGVVYKGLDTRLERTVALKFLPEDRLDESAARQRFRQEAQAASRLDHPNICTIYSVEELPDGRMFIAMALYEGETLRDRISRAPLGCEEAARLALSVAHGLEVAHRQSIVHRDIKPENLMLTQAGVVKILDFGVAKWAGGQGLTQVGKALGTTRYMAPEALRGREIDQRSDLWSLGVVLYEALTGTPPFEGVVQSEQILAILMDPLKPIPAQDHPRWEALEAVVLRALQKEPGERYQDAREMARDLEGFLGTVGASAPGAVEALGTRSMATPRLNPAVAVLPFEDLSQERDQEYFCSGLAEELMVSLARVPGVQVASRTSAAQVAERGLTPQEIGRTLDVVHLLEGSVRKAGARLRITVRLLDTKDGYQLWTERYDREMADLFALQDEIATHVTEALHVTLTGTVEAPRQPAPPQDLESYNLYLQGRFFWNKRTESDLERGVEFFQQALRRDGKFGRAYAGLADSLALLGLYGAKDPRSVMPQAQEAADQALELDPELAEVYVSRAAVRAVYDWDFPGALLDFQRALDRDPGYATAYHWYATSYLLPLGRFEEGIRQMKRAQQLDPLSLPVNVSLGLAYFFSRRHGAAIAEYERALTIDSGFGLGHFFLAQALLETGETQEAIRAFQSALKLSGQSPEMIAGLGVAYARSGNEDLAKAKLDELEGLVQSRYVSPVLFSQVVAALGGTGRALHLLERAKEQRAADLIWLRVRPAFDSLREEPRFQTLLGALGLAPETSIPGLDPSATLEA